MSRISSIIEKIDRLTYVTEIKEVSSLADELLQLQDKKGRGQDIGAVEARGHARYSHLVPMYRTVHRKVPRPMVLRAIRWVNPKRMMPGALLTKEEMMAMSPEELKKLAVDLNKYREEAHVIHNRYNQMLHLIERGKRPYWIGFDVFDGDKWEILAQHEERAERLKAGTEDWEFALDKQAQQLRSILLSDEKGNIRFDDIDELWIGPDGEPRAPNFKDIKRGKKAAAPMRKQRITADGKRLAVEPKIFARTFIAVPENEQRVGERVRMAAAGNFINPEMLANDSQRDLAEQFGDAAMHMVRVPKAPVQMNASRRRILHERGQLLSVPAGREKNPFVIFFGEIPADKVEERIIERWTQRGIAPHVGTDERLGRVPAQGAGRRAQRRAQPMPARLDGNQIIPATPSEIALAKQVNEDYADAHSTIVGKYSDTSKINKMMSITEDDIEDMELIADGVNNNTFKITLQDGEQFVYKVSYNEQKSEALANAIDSALGLNIQQPAAINSNISMDFVLRMAAGRFNVNPESLERNLEMGGGHIQEWCIDCKEWWQTSDQDQLLDTPEFREDFTKICITDFIGGNWDRHGKNFMVTPDGRAVGIDNGFHGEMSETKIRELDNFKIDSQGQLFGRGRGGWTDRFGQINMERRGGLSAASAVNESMAVFDEYFDIDKIKDIQTTFGLGNRNENADTDQIRSQFEQGMKKLWGL